MKVCGVAVAMLQGHSWAPTPSNGSTVNVGTIAVAPSPVSVRLADGKARRRLRPPRWGGGPVVVRDRESRSHDHAGVDPSVGSVGDALDNAMAETTVGSFKNELIRRQGPWRDVDHVELGTAEWVVWFNTERPHNELDDFTPEAVEKLHYDHRRALQEAG